MKRRATVNALSGAVQIAVNIGLVLITVPVFINKLGLPTYGIYALVTAIGGIGVFTNFGFNTSLLKYLAEQNDRQESNYDIVVTLLITGGSSLFVALLSLVFSEFVLFSLLGISPDVATSSVRYFYVTCVGANVFQMVGQVPSAMLDSQQKVYLTNGVQLAIGLLSKGLILVSLFVSPDLATVGWIILASSLAGMGLLGWLALGTWGRVSCPALWAQFMRVLRKHFRYGRSIYATAIMGFFYESVTKVLISHFIGLVEVGFFDIALRIKGLIWSLMERLLYPILPMFAVKSSVSDARTLLEEVQHKLTVIVVPVLVVTVFLSEPIISVWLGPAHWPIVMSVACMVDCYMLALLFVPVYHFLSVKGYPHKTLALQTANVVVNVLSFVCLVPFLGYYGALLAFCLAILASTALCAWYQWSILNSKPITSKVSWMLVAELGGALLVVNTIVTSLTRGDWQRVLSLLAVNALAIVFLFRRLKMVTAEDVERYIGRGNRIGVVLEKLFVQKVS